VSTIYNVFNVCNKHYYYYDKWENGDVIGLACDLDKVSNWAIAFAKP
jgi:hypothetical protein